MVIVAWPILTGGAQHDRTTVGQRTQEYTTAKNLLITGADAVERIMTSFKEVSAVEMTENGLRCPSRLLHVDY